MTPRRRFIQQAGALALALGAGAPALAQDAPSALAKVRERGRLSGGLYHELPPFHADGKGIEVQLAQALAGTLGVQASLLPFHAGENMSDDLRNMVWRGHYLGWGPADVLLHVPVDAPLINASPQVRIFAPYWRERVMMARRVDRTPTLEKPADLAGGKVAVHGLSLAGWLLIGSEGGLWREHLDTGPKSGVQAAQALARGEAAAAAGTASELESVLGRDPRSVIEPIPVPRAPRDGWAVGCAVKKASGDLAEALQAAMNTLAEDGTLARAFTEGGVRWRWVSYLASPRKPTVADVVTVHYEGRLIDGTVFDSSYPRGEPATFPLGRLVKGWQLAIPQMGVGETIEIAIPADLAYGPVGRGPIPGNATLVFKVELIGIEG